MPVVRILLLDTLWTTSFQIQDVIGEVILVSKKFIIVRKTSFEQRQLETISTCVLSIAPHSTQVISMQLFVSHLLSTPFKTTGKYRHYPKSTQNDFTFVEAQKREKKIENRKRKHGFFLFNNTYADFTSAFTIGILCSLSLHQTLKGGLMKITITRPSDLSCWQYVFSNQTVSSVEKFIRETKL